MAIIYVGDLKRANDEFHISRHGQFKYFDLQLGHPTWRGKRVLDFGGNIGNLLRDPNSTIEHDKYWSIDVSKDAIEKGKKEFPQAHWVFYDRYNFAFNPTGIEGLELPPLGQEFDYILAYSVFTHTRRAEMIDLVSQLEKWLAVEGVLAFTFIDPRITIRPKAMETLVPVTMKKVACDSAWKE